MNTTQPQPQPIDVPQFLQDFEAKKRAAKRADDIATPEQIANAFAEVFAMKPNTGIGDLSSQEKGSAARYNGNKPDYSLIPLCTLEDEARVWEHGREKYAAWNWAKGMPWSAVFASLQRHMAAWQRGEANDPESGLPHLAHAMCNLRMLALYEKTYPEGDDRPVKWFGDYRAK